MNRSPLPSPSLNRSQSSTTTVQTIANVGHPPPPTDSTRGLVPRASMQHPPRPSWLSDGQTTLPRRGGSFDKCLLEEGSAMESDVSSAADVTTAEAGPKGNNDYGNSREVQHQEQHVKQARISGEAVQLEALRQAQAKLILSQQMARMGGHPSSKPPGLRSQRVSPIKEEEPPDTESPPFNAAFSSPLPTGAQTTSTESTESARTIRGSVPPTPGQMPLRTPSYPFPNVPATPRVWPSTFHQPFTSLSPTASALDIKDTATPKERTLSGPSSLGGSTSTFLPTGGSHYASEDPDYPSPNLYNLILLLNSEPGLDMWWVAVAKMMREWYRVERTTLSVPADSTDLENHPWGQKATFSISGPRTTNPAYEGGPSKTKGSVPVPADQSLASQSDSTGSAGLHSTGIRPRLQTRHSFAGYERDRRDVALESTKKPGGSVRPQGPLRTASHTPLATPRPEHGVRLAESPTPEQPPIPQAFRKQSKDASFSDLDFSSIGGDGPTSPLAVVFPSLHPLEEETGSLIDAAGINKVLQRGKPVTLTRDYSIPSASGKAPGSSASAVVSKNTHDDSRRASASSSCGPSSRPQHHPQTRGNHGYFDRVLREEAPFSKLPTHYEEYEQMPSSPWAQSPAPSPALQSDPSDNPFFATTSVDEETFSPTNSDQDYSQYGVVEAIGVDHASTIIHVPLIHPVLSQPMPSPDPEPPLYAQSDNRCAGDRQHAESSPGLVFQRRAPVAILSVLSSTVPYPHNLAQSLKFLGPHLATSYSNASQYTITHRQATSLRNRRLASGHHVGFGPLSGDSESYGIMELDIDAITESTTGSITSPSDYSGRSKYSPGGSIAETPGWDPSTIGFASRHSVGGTPSFATVAEEVDSYFDAKKKGTVSVPVGISSPSHAPRPHTHDRPSPALDHRAPSRRAIPTKEPDDDEEVMAQKKEQRLRSRTTVHESKVSTTRTRDLSPARQVYTASPRRPGLRSVSSSQYTERADHRHSLLHSYGADINSSFQNLHLGAATTHARSDSDSDANLMPLPSERLLRVIVDTLPVQIFLAAPTTGALTWVNSKFLVYRGQDTRQVIEHPWQTIHSDDRDEYMALWNRSLRTGQQLQKKVRLLRFDGQYRWFYTRVAPLKDRRSNIVHWVGTNTDFHEQHIAEVNSARQQETAVSEAKYRTLANSSPQIVFAVTRAKGVTFCNSQWLSYSGQTEEEAFGLSFMNFVHPEDIPKCRLPDLAGDGVGPQSAPASPPPEAKRTVSSSDVSEESGETGKTVTSIGSSSTHTPELLQSKFPHFLSAGVPKVSRDADGRPFYSTEVRLRSKDGSYRWHLVRVLLAEPVLRGCDEEKEETWYGTCTDINDHKLLEQTLKETMDAKSRFLSNMSHEIRTPLNGITGMVNFLLDSNLTAEQMEHVNIIKNSADGLSNLINDILDLSKVEAGMITLNMEWFSVRVLIEDVNDVTSALAITKGLELNYVVEEDVPAIVKGDGFRMRQVLLNVIGNAIKFTSVGEIFVRCRLYTDKGCPVPQNEVVIQFEVIDTGSGFTEKEAEFLFKRFSQIDGSSTRQHGGTGLGLAISMQLVELHGGKMRATSQPGRGSTFTFTARFGLPTESDHPPPGMIAPTWQPRSRAPTPLPREDIEELGSHLETHRPSEESNQFQVSIGSSPSPIPVYSSHSSSSSDPSVRTGRTSVVSTRSSTSSIVTEHSLAAPSLPALAHPGDIRSKSAESGSSLSGKSNESTDTICRETSIASRRSKSPLIGSLHPPMFSILVVCPWMYSREATAKHIERALPKMVARQITSRASVEESKEMIGGDDPIIFTHVVLVLNDTEDVISFMSKVLKPRALSSTSLILILDSAQKRDIVKKAPEYDYDQLERDHRLRFIFKPLKPSKFTAIFDPQKEKESSTNRDTAQQVALSQKQVFDQVKKRLGNRGLCVLLVEDNKINQAVLLKYLRKISIDVETAIDGVECTDKVFSHGHGYYSIILCDLHMPNKDGYQTCKEIRRWERKHKYPHLPIIALSANVLGDVYNTCAEAGFNSYVTKPVDFKALGMAMTQFLDPVDPSKPHAFMRPRRE